MTPATRLERLADAVRLMLGVSSYRRYREHMAAAHPDAPVLTRGAFFNARQEARYGGRGGGRCC
jgi:uncharacterized short protein YbdD (DUF466 family)